jgi:hypothetical protein
MIVSPPMVSAMTCGASTRNLITPFNASRAGFPRRVRNENRKGLLLNDA